MIYLFYMIKITKIIIQINQFYMTEVSFNVYSVNEILYFGI